MLRFAVLAILFAAICAAPTTEEPSSSELDVVAVESIDDYLALNPELELVDQLEKEEISNRQQFRYTLGKRVAGEF